MGLPRGLAIALALCVPLVAGDGPLNAAPEEPDRVPAPQRGGVFRVFEEAPESLDPAELDSVYESLPIGQIFDGLVALDPGLNIVPALADTWTISRDGRDYMIHVRRGVKFHDGSPLTAQDVAFSLRRVLDPKRAKRSLAASYLQVVAGAPEFSSGQATSLSGIVAIDPSRVEIKLSRPYLSFLAVLAMDDLRIVPEHVLAAAGDTAMRRAPVGTGPFRFVGWTDEGIRLAANPSYFGGAPYLDEVMIYFPHADERDRGNARFLRGEIDIVTPTSDTLPLLQSDPEIEVYRSQDLNLSFLGMNTTIPPLNDARIRRAIASAIDRHALAALSPGTRSEAQGILPPGLPTYSPSPKAVAYAPDEARRLLAGAGHPHGSGLRPIPFYTAQWGSTDATRSLDALRGDLGAVGIPLEVHQVTWAELNDRIERHQAPLFQLGWVADLPDPDSFLRSLFETGGTANYFDFCDDETGRALEHGASEMNPLERARIYRGLERSILEKAPIVPLFHSVGVIASRRSVHGLRPGPMGFGALGLETVWLDRSRSAS